MPKFSEFENIAKEHGQGGNSGEWFRPSEGESRIRILSDEFEVLAKHWIPSLNKSFVCYGKDKGCPHDSIVKDKNTGEEKKIHKPGIKYLVWMIDRKDGKIKIGELPYSVTKLIASLKDNEEYGFSDVPSYDITIKRTKTGTAATDVEYNVIPARKDTVVTESELNEFNEKTSLTEIVQKMKDKEMSKNSIEKQSTIEDVEDVSEE